MSVLSIPNTTHKHQPDQPFDSLYLSFIGHNYNQLKYCCIPY